MVRGRRRICSCALHEAPRRVSYQVYQEHQDRLLALALLQDDGDIADEGYLEALLSDNLQDSDDVQDECEMAENSDGMDEAEEGGYNAEGSLFDESEGGNNSENSEMEENSSESECNGSDLAESVATALDEDGTLQQGSAGISTQYLELIASSSLSIDEHFRDSLLLMQWKQASRTSNYWYEVLRKLPQNSEVMSDDACKRRARTLSKMRPIRYDCCVNSCMAFIDYVDERGKNNHLGELDQCDICGEDRFETVKLSTGVQQRSRKTYTYLPLIPRLQVRCANTQCMSDMKEYRAQACQVKDVVSDFYDSRLYEKLCKDGLMDDDRAILLSLSTDGITLVRQKGFSVWPILVINLSLSPSERVKLKNMLPIGLIPGPRGPQNLNSFLVPFVDEMLQLKEGISAIDGTEEMGRRYYLMKAYTVAVTGDNPAVAKLMCMAGHNGKLPCRSCKIAGEWSTTKRHYYYPHTVPGQRRLSSGIVLNARLNMKRDIRLVAASGSQTLCRDTGHTGVPVLLRLSHSIHFPRSFGHDTMHLFTNVARLMFQHWAGLGATQESSLIDLATGDSYILPSNVWEDIGLEQIACRGVLPTSLARTPRSIFRHHQSYKAKEWEAWVFLFSVPLLAGRLPSYALDHWILFVKAMSMTYIRRITQAEIDEIEDIFVQFVLGYEAIYYQEESQLSHCRSQIHHLLHISDSLRDIGPAFTFWQFTTERYVGTLEALVTSRSQINSSLTNNLVNNETLKMLNLTHGSLPFWMETDEEHLPDDSVSVGQGLALMGPSKCIRLTAQTCNLLANFLGQDIDNCDAVFWPRMRLNGKAVGSKRWLKDKKQNRRNDLVEYVQAADSSLGYGQIEMFIEYQVQPNATSIHAAILRHLRHTRDQEIQQDYFVEERELQCVGLDSIVRLVGFIGSNLDLPQSNNLRRRRYFVTINSDL